MFGIQYLKASPTQYVLHYQNGRLRREGVGLAFFAYRPAATIVVVPLGSADVPFIFSEISADFQPLTVQGQLTYRVQDPQRVAALLNYTIGVDPESYTSDDPEKLPQRLINQVQVLVRAELQNLPLRQAMQASDEIAGRVFQNLAGYAPLEALGVEVLALSIQAIRPVPEIARALEAEAREDLLRRADQAIYDRRNAAVEQERRIKENELNTEIVVEEKKRQIRETKVEADLAVEGRDQLVRQAKLNGQIQLEEDRKKLVAARSENTRSEADAQAYTIQASLRPLEALDADLLQLLSVQSVDPRLMVSMALKEIARNAGKIGSLNITPDLLDSLMREKV